MSDVKLSVQSRKKDFKSNQEEIPAVIYGPKSKNQNLTINYKNFEKAYKAVGESTLIDLTVDDKDTIKVLVHDVQHNPLNGNYIHVDFYQLDMTKKTQVEVTINLLGSDQIEKNTGGEVIANLDKIIVECLPKDLIKEIEFDASKYLKELDDTILAKDINLPEGLELITDGAVPVATLREIREEIIEEPEVKEEVEGEAAIEGEEKEEDTGEDKPGEEKGDKKEEKK